MPNWHPKNTQKGMVLIWMIVWLAGMAAIFYWCVLKHIPAIEQRIQSNAQTALSNGGYESIDVTVSDRIATLSGAVSSEAERSNIVESVSAAEGVRSVNDDLTLLAKNSTNNDTPTATATATTDENDNIVAKAVIPVTPEPAQTDAGAQDATANSVDEQDATESTALIDSQSATDEKAISTPEQTPAASDSATESETQTAADDSQTTENAAESETQAAADATQTTENAAESETQAGADATQKASSDTTASDTEAEDTSVVENASVSTDTNDNDAASTINDDSGTSESAVTTTTSDTTKAIDAKQAEIENKANERIKAALAKQEQSQTDKQAEQPVQPEQVAIQLLPPTLNLQMDGNSLTVTGDLSENDDALDLIESAMSTFGTPIVVNKIQTHDDRSSAPWLNNVTRFLPNMQGIKNAGVRINEQQIVLSGDAPTEAAHDNVINQALSSLPSLSLVERMRVMPEKTPNAETEIAAESNTPTNTTNAPKVSSIDDFLADYNELQNTTILFESGSTTLTEDSVGVAIQIATVLNGHPNIKIGIDGHTDNAGQSDVNLRLSQERSNAVRDTLIDQGVDVDRINAYGFGDGVPIADNSTPEGRRLNRRIEFNFKLDQSR